ncbi:hypothetical protein XF_1492 [Xylella fastidiosa 9a5c]|uniref:Uncharacterized protein n=1 Tax=Xylella fastidiosa (strain 9a5c) TaxID=160492 RepID=Q9PD87_XYLFA|nr:hypothetical protein XF_1492 [Xylella fastidiosa 9a5c]
MHYHCAPSFSPALLLSVRTAIKSDHQSNIILAVWRHGKTEIDIPKQKYDIVYEKFGKKLNEAFQPATATK